jgi:probable F420-dependent oxidoreductase
MPHPRRFRFAAQLSTAPGGTGASWAEQARKVEDLGYSALHMPDHFGDQLAPAPALVAAAAATERLKVGTLVYDNDYRHPLMLAKEAATVDLLSDGRLELSLGAGWMRTDYEQSGIPYDPPAVRVDRFEEAVTVVKGLLEATEPYSFTGKHYTIADHTPTPRPVQRPRPPLIIGGGARRVLSIAGREADIVSINVDLRAGTAGPEAAPNATPEATRRKVQWVREAAGTRFDDIELNTLIGFVVVTDDRDELVRTLAPTFGIEPEDALHVPLGLIGTLEQMEEELQWRREEYGMSYFSVEGSAWEQLGPVVSRLSGR